MRLAVTVKIIGKRQNTLSRIPVELLPSPRTLRELIAGLVEWNIRGLLEKQQQVALVPYLTAEEVQEQAEIGKVGFGAVYNDGVPDVQQAVDTAILAFEDGLYRVFVCEREIGELDEPLALKEDDEIVLILFTMLAGRLW